MEIVSKPWGQGKGFWCEGRRRVAGTRGRSRVGGGTLRFGRAKGAERGLHGAGPPSGAGRGGTLGGGTHWAGS